MSHLKTLREANIKRDREWASGAKISLSFRGNELAGETGEACNIIKKLERHLLGLKGSRTTVDKLEEELADVVICTDLIAMDLNIDLVEAIQAKFNASSDKNGLSTRLDFSTQPDKASMVLLYSLEKTLLSMQAAVIEYQHGGGAEGAMEWIINTLAQPGNMPDKAEMNAQAYFDRESEKLDENHQRNHHAEQSA